MAINLKTEEGMEFSFDTVEELMDFKKQLDAEEAPKESEDEIEVPKSEPKFEVGDMVKVVENNSGGHVVGTIGEIAGVRYVDFHNRWSYEVSPIAGYQRNWSQRHKETDLEFSGIEIKVEVGDKVRVVSAEDGSDTPYHYHDVGSVGKVVGLQQFGRIEVDVDGEEQYLLPHHYVKVESLGKDANGEDLYEGDYVTGSEDNDYAKTNDTVVMRVEGAGGSILFREANIRVKIVGDEVVDFIVDSSKFIKLSDNLEEAEAKFYGIKGDEEEREFKVGDRVRVVGNRAGHALDEGDVKIIYEVDSDEPKYNLSYSSNLSWAHSEDIEHADSPTEFKTGDIVRVTEAFEDVFKDRVTCGAVYNYDENLVFGEPFVGTVFLGDNKDKIELVCRAEDRLDK